MVGLKPNKNRLRKSKQPLTSLIVFYWGKIWGKKPPSERYATTTCCDDGVFIVSRGKNLSVKEIRFSDSRNAAQAFLNTGEPNLCKTARFACEIHTISDRSNTAIDDQCPTRCVSWPRFNCSASVVGINNNYSATKHRRLRLRPIAALFRSQMTTTVCAHSWKCEYRRKMCTLSAFGHFAGPVKLRGEHKNGGFAASPRHPSFAQRDRVINRNRNWKMSHAECARRRKGLRNSADLQSSRRFCGSKRDVITPAVRGCVRHSRKNKQTTKRAGVEWRGRKQTHVLSMLHFLALIQVCRVKQVDRSRPSLTTDRIIALRGTCVYAAQGCCACSVQGNKYWWRIINHGTLENDVAGEMHS